MVKGDGKRLTQKEMLHILIENFVGLQKAMTNLSIKFETLSEHIRKLLEIFEISAKKIADEKTDFPDKEEIMKKLDTLLEQNKILAKGIVLIEEKSRHQALEEEFSPETAEPIKRKPLPRL